MNSTYLFGLTSNETYTIAVIALTEDGQSQQQAVITAQTDTEVTIVNLYNTSTSLEAATQIDAEDALYTYFSIVCAIGMRVNHSLRRMSITSPSIGNNARLDVKSSIRFPKAVIRLH